MSNDKLAQALRAERDLRILGQQPDVHWESLRDMRRAVYAATDEALAAHEAEKQAEPLKGYCRLLKYEGGVWVPATEFLPGPPADDWIKLAETDEHWRIDRRPSGPQLRRAFETAFSKPPVQNTAPPSPLSEQAGPVAEPLGYMRAHWVRELQDGRDCITAAIARTPCNLFTQAIYAAPPSTPAEQDKVDAEPAFAVWVNHETGQTVFVEAWKTFTAGNEWKPAGTMTRHQLNDALLAARAKKEPQ